MFNIGAGEMIFILVAALLILGPSRLPELARGIGKFLREFRRQTDEVRSVVTREFYEMDRDLEREPPRPAPQPPVPEPSLLSQASLPPPPALPHDFHGGIHPHPQHLEPAPEAGQAAQAGAPAVANTLAQPGTPAGAPVGAPAGAPAGASEAAPPGAAPEQEEPLPRFDPIPGTVARNAPKQS
jgi:sec-independent protein translocase protein TatB